MLQTELLFPIQKFHVATIAGPPTRIVVLWIIDHTASARFKKATAGCISTGIGVDEEEGDVARS